MLKQIPYGQRPRRYGWLRGVRGNLIIDVTKKTIKGAIHMKELYFIGVDIDDLAFHFSVVDIDQKILKRGVRTKRDHGALLKVIKKDFKLSEVTIGYEATYDGYTMARFFKERGINCLVIVPTSIGKSSNDRVKNDRIDSYRLAIGLCRREFQFVDIPDIVDESNRQLTRTRHFIVDQQSSLKRHIIAMCRVYGLDFKKETEALSYWTKAHHDWLDKSMRKLKDSARVTLAIALQQLESNIRNIETIEVEIAHMAKTSKYKEAIEALMLFKGISLITAAVIVTEIRDIRRFSHPKQLVAYLGLDIGEHSSGGKQVKFGITKKGNWRGRTALVESCQMFSKSKTPSKRALAQRRGAKKHLIEIADRCQERLYKKGMRLLAIEKPRNAVKVACAREMVGFIWEAMRVAA
jgi:transposase